MKVRELIEHLAQYEPDLEVKIRDYENPMTLRAIQPHAVELERTTQDIFFPKMKLVVVLG